MQLNFRFVLDQWYNLILKDCTPVLHLWVFPRKRVFHWRPMLGNDTRHMQLLRFWSWVCWTNSPFGASQPFQEVYLTLKFQIKDHQLKTHYLCLQRIAYCTFHKQLLLHQRGERALVFISALLLQRIHSHQNHSRLQICMEGGKVFLLLEEVSLSNMESILVYGSSQDFRPLKGLRLRYRVCFLVYRRFQNPKYTHDPGNQSLLCDTRQRPYS